MFLSDGLSSHGSNIYSTCSGYERNPLILGSFLLINWSDSPTCPQTRTVTELTETQSQILTEPPVRTGTVLIVEDDPTNLKYFTLCIRRLGLAVESARDGFAGVETFKREPDRFTVVLMDLQMPNCSGEDAFQLIRESGPLGAKVPVIAATAHASPSCRQKCMDLGMNDFLAKPCLPRQITDVLMKWLSPLDPESKSANPCFGDSASA